MEWLLGLIMENTIYIIWALCFIRSLSEKGKIIVKVKDYMKGDYDLEIVNKEGKYLGTITSEVFIDDSEIVKIFENRKVYDSYKENGYTNGPLQVVINYPSSK